MGLFGNETLGIIGGMGPLATDMFFNMVISKTDGDKDQDHIDMIILNHASMPDRTQAIKSGDLREIQGKLLQDAKFLENAGAARIAVPCNTSHYILMEIQKDVNIPIMSMIDMAVNKVEKDIRKKEFNDSHEMKVGIMATDGTVEMGLYQKALSQKGFQWVIPDRDVQSRVMEIIYDNVKKGIEVPDGEFAVIDDFFRKSGCRKVILACTELSVYKMQKGLDDYYVDAMEALAEEVILSFGKKIRDEKQCM